MHAAHICPACGGFMLLAWDEYVCAQGRCRPSVEPGECECGRRVQRPILGGAYCCPGGCDSRVQTEIYHLYPPQQPQCAFSASAMAADPTRGRRGVQCPRCARDVDAVLFQPSGRFEIYYGCPVCEFAWNPALTPTVHTQARPSSPAAYHPPVPVYIKREAPAPPSPGIRLLCLPPDVPVSAMAEDPRFARRRAICPRCHRDVDSLVLMPRNDRLVHRGCPECDHVWNPLDCTDDAYAFVVSAPAAFRGKGRRRKR